MVHRCDNGHVAYVLATHLLCHVCLYLVNLCVGNLPVTQLAFVLKGMDIASWQDATSVVLLFGGIAYIFLVSLLQLLVIFVWSFIACYVCSASGI